MVHKQENVLRLVGLLYDAVVDAALWGTFLQEVSNALGANSTSLFLYEPNRRDGSIAASAGLDKSTEHRYNDYYVGVDPWGIHGRDLCSPGSVLTGQQLCPDQVLRRSEFYADFLRPIDCFHEVCGIVARNADTLSVITSLRCERAGPFNAEDQQLLAALVPHLQRATVLHSKIAGLHGLAAASLESLDTCPYGIVLVARDRHVIAMNSRATAMARDGDGIGAQANGMVARRPDETARLHRLIRQAIETSIGRGVSETGAMSISRPSCRRPYQLLIAPLRTGALWPGQKQPVVAIIITDPESCSTASAEVIGQLFGLTKAETRLALALTDGRTLQEAAADLHVALSTARSQLKKIFEKTHTRRQSELIRVLLVSPAMIRAHRREESQVGSQ